MISSTYKNILLLSIIAIATVNATAVRHRRDDDDSSESTLSEISSALINAMNTTAQYVLEIPLIGSLFGDVLYDIVDGIDDFEEATNGAIGRLLGGALPCTIYLEFGLVCEGIKSQGGFAEALMDAIDLIPGLVFPSFAKDIVDIIIEYLADPVSDILLGGVIKN